MRTPSIPFLPLILLIGLFVSPAAFGIPITSSQGKTVDFVGVKSASPAGLEVQVKAGGPTLTLPWSRLDLKKLESENPKIHEARIKTLDGKKEALNLGSFAPKKPKSSGRMEKLKAMGVYQDSMKGKSSDNFSILKMAVKLPNSKVKGIFLKVTGAAVKINEADEHFAAALFDTTTAAIGVGGAWTNFAEENNLAIVGISVDIGGLKKGAVPYYDMTGGLGDAVLRLIDKIADVSKKEELKTAPLVLYGRDVGGASFVYNLVQWKPERVVAAAVVKGAFYNTPPTEISAKVPIIFVEGEYDDDWQYFGGKNLGKEVVEKYVDMKPNWTYVLEPRGTSNDNILVFTVTQAFLKKVTSMRMGEDGLTEMDRSKAWVGEVNAMKASKAGSGTEWKAGKTWLPDARFAKTWEEFVHGTLKPYSPNQ
jgi:predicted esterase